MTSNQVWNDYLKTTNIKDADYQGSYSFGTVADELANLVVTNKKTATSSLIYSYEQEQLPLPKANQYYIIEDSSNKPVAIIRNTEIRQFKFKDVTAEIAELEGEGTLEKWIEDHELFFTNELKQYGKQFNDQYLVLTEIFEVVKVFGKKWNIKVNRDSVCMGDDVTNHEIIYQMKSNSIELEQFINQARNHQISCRKSEEYSSFLATVVGGSRWNIVVRDEFNKQELHIANVIIDVQEKIIVDTLIEDYILLTKKKLTNKMLYFKLENN